jgi:hypothetical protein
MSAEMVYTVILAIEPSIGATRGIVDAISTATSAINKQLESVWVEKHDINRNFTAGNYGRTAEITAANYWTNHRKLIARMRTKSED